MATLKVDARRRITLPKELVQQKEFIAIKTSGGILLKPLLTNPLESLAKEGKKLKRTTKQLRKEAEALATQEALR